jgi:AraC-like DNA-binding protein
MRSVYRNSAIIMDSLDSPARAPSLPLVTVTEILDPTLVSEGFEVIDIDAVQLHSAPMLARRVVVDLDGVMVAMHSTDLRVRTRSRLRSDVLALVAFRPKARGKVNGLEVRAGFILAAGPEAEVDFVTDRDWETLSFLLPLEESRAHLAVRGRAAELPAAGAAETLQLEPERARRLYEWGVHLLDTARHRPELLAPGSVGRSAARVELIEQVLAAMGAAGPLEATSGDRTRQAYGRIVRAAEEYTLSRPDEAIYLTDLCRATRASERTLEHAFKTLLGITPVSYLIRLRLHRAREELLATPPRSTTVTAVALRWGFWHLGGFSRAYKDCFAERPSETRRRAQRTRAAAKRPQIPEQRRR